MSKRQVNKEQRDRIEAWRKDAEGLSYEEAMQALDQLLTELRATVSRWQTCSKKCSMARFI